MKHWPNNICGGKIRYGRAHNYDGFFLADDEHGIPTLGSVTDTASPTIRGEHVSVFNYPGQTEDIAKQLVLRWNSHQALVDALARYEAWEADVILNADWSGETPRLTQEQWDRLVELQAARNAALLLARGESQ